MKIAITKLQSLSPYSQSRYHNSPKLEKEGNDDYRERTWRNHLHTDKAGTVVIPPMAFKNCLSEAAKYLSIQIPGKGKATYTKHIESGVLVLEPSPIGIKAADVEPERLFLPSDGIRGSGKRVEKVYPILHDWEATVTWHIYDDTVTEEVFRKVLSEAGKFVGIGRFRPRNNGYYGRFEMVSLDWEDKR